MSTVIDLAELPPVPWPIVWPPAEQAAAVSRDTARAAAAHGRRVRGGASLGLVTSHHLGISGGPGRITDRDRNRGWSGSSPLASALATANRCTRTRATWGSSGDSSHVAPVRATSSPRPSGAVPSDQTS